MLLNSFSLLWTLGWPFPFFLWLEDCTLLCLSLYSMHPDCFSFPIPVCLLFLFNAKMHATEYVGQQTITSMCLPKSMKILGHDPHKWAFTKFVPQNWHIIFSGSRIFLRPTLQFPLHEAKGPNSVTVQYANGNKQGPWRQDLTRLVWKHWSGPYGALTLTH